MQNIKSAIHNRVSTICQSYVKKYHPVFWQQFCEKAEAEYSNGARRRATEEAMEAIVNPQKDPNNPYNDPGYIG